MTLYQAFVCWLILNEIGVILGIEWRELRQ